MCIQFKKRVRETKMAKCLSKYKYDKINKHRSEESLMRKKSEIIFDMVAIQFARRFSSLFCAIHVLNEEHSMVVDTSIQFYIPRKF